MLKPKVISPFAGITLVPNVDEPVTTIDLPV
jgi:hypothetical protein